jgi:CBS domain containing-hemolysin-like protein
MTLLILYVLLAIGVSFLCSIMEAVLLSITPSYVAALEGEGSATGARIRALKKDIDRPLAAILTLNTFAHTLGAAGAGAQAVVVFGDAYIGAFSAVLTLLILILSEIIPKTLGAVYWRQLAGPMSAVIRPLIWVLYPLVWLSQLMTKLLSRGHEEKQVNRAEFAALATLGAEEGVFDPQESRILQSLLRFNDLVARDVMTPRTVMVAFPSTKPVREISNTELRFSRFPVFEDNRDHVTGYALRSEILRTVAEDRGDTPVGEIQRDVLTVPEMLPLPRLFERLLERKEHLALVVDEYGGTQGIATMEDVVETLLGLEIVDEADTVQDMQVLARERWVERARALGLLDETSEEELAETMKERDAGVKYGITGGVAPKTTSIADETDEAEVPDEAETSRKAE